MRYFWHPESNSVWGQEESEPDPRDGDSYDASLIQEITFTEYLRLKEELNS